MNVGPVVVGTKGVWSQSPSGTIFLADTVTNSGFIRFQGGGSTCGGSNNITLSASGGSSSWSGGGTFILNDLTIKDMRGGLTAYSSQNNSTDNVPILDHKIQEKQFANLEDYILIHVF